MAEDNFNAYPDGDLQGNGSAADAGWAGAWFAAPGLPGARVESGSVVLPNPPATVGRVHRSLKTTIGGASHNGGRAVIKFDLEFGTGFSAFETHLGGSSDADHRTTAFFAFDGGQALRIGTADVNIPDATGIHSYQLEIAFGVTNADEDRVSLFRGGNKLVDNVEIGTSFMFDRLGFSAFGGAMDGSVPHADNLSLTVSVPEPNTLGLISLIGLGVTLRRRRPEPAHCGPNHRGTHPATPASICL